MVTCAYCLGSRVNISDDIRRDVLSDNVTAYSFLRRGLDRL